MFECKSKEVLVQGQTVKIQPMNAQQVWEYQDRIQESKLDKKAKAKCLGFMISCCVYDQAGMRVFPDGESVLEINMTAFEQLLTHVMDANGIRGAADPTPARRKKN